MKEIFETKECLLRKTEKIPLINFKLNLKKLKNKQQEIIAQNYKTYFMVNKKHHYDIIKIYKVRITNPNDILEILDASNQSMRYLNFNDIQNGIQHNPKDFTPLR